MPLLNLIHDWKDGRCANLGNLVCAVSRLGDEEVYEYMKRWNTEMTMEQFEELVEHKPAYMGRLDFIKSIREHERIVGPQ